MTDPIRHLFDQLEPDPSPAFVDALRVRVADELNRQISAAAAIDITQGDIMTITERPRVEVPEQHPRRRSGVVAAAVAAAAAIVLVGILVHDNRHAPTPATTVPPTTVATTTPTTTASTGALPQQTAAPIVRDPGIFQVRAAGSTVWAAGNASTALLQIDPTTGATLHTVTLPQPALQDWMGSDKNLLYVPVTGGVVIVDSASRRAGAVLAPGQEVVAMAFTNDSVWLVRGGSSLEQWNLALTTRARSVPLSGFTPGGMIGVGNDVYLATDTQGLLHYDRTGTLVRAIPKVGYSFNMGFGLGSIWVPDYDSGELLRIDPTTDTVTTRIRIDFQKSHSIAITKTAVWVTNYFDNSLFEVDPATNAVVAKTPANGGPMSVAAAGGRVVVAGDGWLLTFAPAVR
jgi:YVTN family beta-propeller protein